MSMTFADTLRPATQRKARAYDVALVLGGSLLIALSAYIRIPLPFSPIPVTGQTLTVLLLGALLGSRRGTLAVLAYLAEGCLGLPIFQGGHAGLLYLLGSPTAGYLIGFIFAAYVTGRLAEQGWDRHVATTCLAMLIGNLIIYACGVSWLATRLGTFLGSQGSLALGLYPFIPGDILKITLATGLLPSGWKLVNTISGGTHD